MQLADAANGLEYMHGLNMVHGDFKGVRVLQSADAQTFTVKIRRISSSIRVAVPALRTLDSQQLSVQNIVGLMHLQSQWPRRHLSCHLRLVGLLGG